MTTEDIQINDENIFLLLHLLEKNLVEDIKNFDESVVGIWSRTVLKLIESKDRSWESMVPVQVAREVKKKNLFR